MLAGTVLLSLPAIGCVADPSEDSEAIQTAEQADSVIIMNGVEPGYFWQQSTQQALRALGQAPLSGALDGSAGKTMLSSSQGQVLLAHIVSCALPQGDSITSASGVSFTGAVGLASSWKTQPLSSSASRRWVTACLLQSLNGWGVSVPIHLIGSHRAIAEASNTSGFTVPDATMFGDLFDSLNRSAYACVDNPELYSCNLTWSSYTLQRICGTSPTCGMVLLGLCPLVCDDDANGAPTCTAPNGTMYVESIASTLQDTGSVPGPLCSVLSGVIDTI